MIYKFIAISDIHWGAMDCDELYSHLQLVIEFIREMRGELDFIVICGDYFDYRIQMNSRTALLAMQWMEDLVTVCKENDVKKIRIIRGTSSHDYDQLEIFRPPYETYGGFFRIYNQTTIEELLPGLKVIFCPDENINLIDYYGKYWRCFIQNPHIGFFHGNFDTILPKIEYQRIQEHKLPTIIYEYDFLSRFIQGPMIAGHWHIPQEYKSQFYTGSFDRWKFGEEEPKGFIYGQYDTDTNKYFIHRVVNPYARTYKTLIITDDKCKTPADFAILAETVRKIIHFGDSDLRLKVMYVISEPSDEKYKNLSVFQQQFANMRQVKIEVKDLAKKEEKTRKKETVEIEAEKFNYITNTNPKDIPGIIQRFLSDKKGINLSLEQIQKYVSKYLGI